MIKIVAENDQDELKMIKNALKCAKNAQKTVKMAETRQN
jgi:hypothetical protein